MNRRHWLKTVLTASVLAPLASLLPDTGNKLLHIYRLDANRCNPKRIRMSGLKPGDLFVTHDPESKWTGSIMLCLENPRIVDVMDIRSWSVMCEDA